MNDILLEVKDLHAGIEGKEILKGINLTIRPGEVHAIMGPNGSGKSTLSGVLAGDPRFTVTGGSADFHGVDLLALSPENRSHEGLFLSFQYPVEIPGVSMVNFMRAAVNAKRKYFDEAPLSAGDFLKLMRQKRAVVELDNKLASRSVNEGFSGGEKKRNEIFQMAVLEPRLSILDETDSGRRPPHRCIRCKQTQDRPQRHHRNHSLPAPARLYQARLRTHLVQRPYCVLGRPRTGSRTRGERIRLD